MEKYRPEMGLILEPTGLRVAIAHKGALRPVITVYGKAAHSSSTSGVNAVSIAGEVLRDLERYRNRVMNVVDPLLGRSSLEVTMIRGGERINVIPVRCHIYVDRRLTSARPSRAPSATWPGWWRGSARRPVHGWTWSCYAPTLRRAWARMIPWYP